MGDVIKSFERFFAVERVTTDAALKQALHLRYQVYCLETGFESAREHYDGLERDAYDAHSEHSLLTHKPSGMIAGTVRLVLPHPHDVDRLFPIERHCGVFLGESARPWGEVPRHQVAEISRFCISKQFKRRLAEPLTLWGSPHGGPDTEISETRLIPHISVGLFAGVVQMSAVRNIKYWFAVMEPALLRLLKRFGIHFHPIGPVVDYHGLRQPCFAAAHEVLDEMHAACHDVWQLITADGRLWPAPSSSTNSFAAAG